MITGIGMPISQSNAALPIVASQLERETNAPRLVGFQNGGIDVVAETSASRLASCLPSASKFNSWDAGFQQWRSKKWVIGLAPRSPLLFLQH